MVRSITSSIAAVTLLGASSIVSAVPIIFFGEDLATGRMVPPGGNAVSARTNFLSKLAGGVGTEDFESFSSGDAAPYNLTFPGATGNISATLANASGICDETVNCLPPASGEFPTSGDRWVFTDESLSLTFSDPIAAFGFFGTDIGDFGAQLTVTLTEPDGGNAVFTVPHTNGNSNSNGDLLFWGFVEPSTTYMAIQFGLDSGNGEFFGFDDMTISDTDQVRVPEPTTLALMALGLAGLGYTRRKAA